MFFAIALNPYLIYDIYIQMIQLKVLFVPSPYCLDSFVFYKSFMNDIYRYIKVILLAILDENVLI